VLVEQRRR